MSRFAEDLNGQKFGRLTVIKRGPGRVHGKDARRPSWICKCECGQIKDVLAHNLKRSNTISCGCWADEKRSEIHTTHGKRNSNIYSTWRAMVKRCHSKSNINYKNYGGRGILVCDRWRKFENFYMDMGDPPLGLTLERVDNNKGYSKENCIWETMRAQSWNRRVVKLFMFNGKSLPLSEISKETGIDYHTLRHRLFKQKLSFEEALKREIRCPKK